MITSSPTNSPTQGSGISGINPTPTPTISIHSTATPKLNQPSNKYDYTPLLVIGGVGVLALLLMGKKKRR